eukprot:3624958-Prymnesium_polylepis.1
MSEFGREAVPRGDRVSVLNSVGDTRGCRSRTRVISESDTREAHRRGLAEEWVDGYGWVAPMTREDWACASQGWDPRE